MYSQVPLQQMTCIMKEQFCPSSTVSGAGPLHHSDLYKNYFGGPNHFVIKAFHCTCEFIHIPTQSSEQRQAVF